MNNKIDEIMKSMTFDFFGNGKHKITPSIHLSSKNSVFLDVRSKEELETIAFSLVHHMPVLHIPIDEIPARLSEIPCDKTVGIFCSSGVRSTMTYFYLRTLGFDNVRIIEGGYAELVDDFKPGKLLKHITKGKTKE
ncbi:MAG: rhodanese-like domain-containing protein [Chitinispirillaceae bacterium]|nr:rhodanese-like domain-containing protein [Chitinispirillaceae bacterium]